MAIVDRREIEFDRDAVKLALEWSPQAAQAFGLPPLKPDGVRCAPADGLVQVTYGKLTATRVFCAARRGARRDTDCLLQSCRDADGAQR